MVVVEAIAERLCLAGGGLEQLAAVVVVTVDDHPLEARKGQQPAFGAAVAGQVAVVVEVLVAEVGEYSDIDGGAIGAVLVQCM